MKLSLVAFVTGLALTTSAEHTWWGGRGVKCTGENDGNISCKEEKPTVCSLINPRISSQNIVTHLTNQLKQPTKRNPSTMPKSLKLDSRALVEHGLSDMSPFGEALSPLEARDLEKRASCELGGDKFCFGHCFAIGYCHAHCNDDNICVCTCLDSTWGICLGTADCQ